MAFVMAISGFAQTYNTPFTENFEDTNTYGNWTLSTYGSIYGGDANWWIIGAIEEGNKCLYITDTITLVNEYRGSTANRTYQYAVIQVHFDTADIFYLEYDLRVGGENLHSMSSARTGDFLSVYMIPNTTSVTAYNGYPTGSITLQEETYNVPSTTRQTLIIPGSYSGTTQQIVFVWKASKIVCVQPAPSIDNISMYGTSCKAVTDLTCKSLSDDSTMVYWTNADELNTTDYIISYESVQDANFTSINVSSTGTFDSLFITGLNANTDYLFGIERNCTETTPTIYKRFRTPTRLITSFPYEEDFEGNAPEDDWYFKTNEEQNWYVGNATGNIGNSMYISNDNGITNSYRSLGDSSYKFLYNNIYACMRVGFGDHDEYTLSFDYKVGGERTISAQDSTDDFLAVYIMPDSLLLPDKYIPTKLDPSSVVRLTDILVDSTTWTNISIPLRGYNNVKYKLFFMWRNDGQMSNNPPAAIDNISISEAACTSPLSLAADSITYSGATISWLSPNNNFVLYYKIKDAVTYDSVIVNGETFYTFNNLNSATFYEMYVVSKCDTLRSSNSDHLVFLTNCNYTLPYTENFNSFDADSVMMSNPIIYPLFWQRYLADWAYNNVYYDPINLIKAYCGSNQNKSLMMTSNAIAVLPIINTEYTMDSLYLKLQMWAEAKYDTAFLYVGIMTDASDTNTFSPIDTLFITREPYDVTRPRWQEFYVPFDNYTGIGKYIALKSYDMSGIYVDNIEVDKIPSCVDIIDMHLLADRDDAITVVWDSSAYPSGQSFQILYGNSSAFNIATATAITTSQNPYIITGLDTNTQYTVAMRAACGGDFSIDSAKTLRKAATIPYSCNFEDTIYENNQWVFYERGCDIMLVENIWTIGNAVNVKSSGSQDTTVYGHSLYITPKDSSVAGYGTNAYCNYMRGTSFVKRLIKSTGAPSYVLEFDSRVGGQYFHDFMKVYIAPTSVEFMDTMINGDPFYSPSYPAYALALGGTNGYEQLIGSPYYYNHPSAPDSINHHILVIPQSMMGDSNEERNLVFMWTNDYYSGTQRGAMVDNIHLIEQTCFPVDSLSVVSVGEDSMTLSWAGDTIGDWVLIYKANGGSSYDSVDVTTNPFVLYGLDANTLYEASLLTRCDTFEYSTPSLTTFSFRTQCQTLPQTIPWSDTFEEGLYCWNIVNSDSNDTYRWMPVKIGEYPFCYPPEGYGGYMAKLQTKDMAAGNYSVMISPEINIPSSGMNLSFNVYKSTDYTTSDSIAVYINSTDDTIGMTYLYGVNPWNTAFSGWQTEVVNIPDNIIGNRYIIFKGISDHGGNLYIDNVSVSSCATPKNLVIDTVTPTSVTIRWDSSSVAGWRLYYSAYMSDNTWDSVDINTNPYTLTSLNPSTEYKIYLVSLCDSVTHSNSSLVSTFHTTCLDMVTEVHENFEAYNADFPYCWNRILPQYAYILDSPIVYRKVLYMQGNSYITNNFVTSPMFDSSIDMSTITVKLMIQRLAGIDPNQFAVEVGLMSDPMDTSTFVPIDTLLCDDGNVWYEKIVRFSSYTGTGRYYVAFARRGAVSGNSGSGVVQIGNVDIYIETCPEPTEINVINVGTNAATISFDGQGASSWRLYYKPVWQTEYDSITITDSNYVLSNLYSGTVYDIKLKTLCESTLSKYPISATFSTECLLDTIHAFPWQEGFENGIICWNQICSNGNALWRITQGYTNSNWGSNHVDINATEGNNFAIINQMYSNGMVTALVTPVLDISTLQNPSVAYSHIQQQYDNPDLLSVYYRASDTAVWVQIADYPSSIAYWNRDTISLPNPSSTYQLAFAGHIQNGFGVGLDDIVVFDHIIPPTVETDSVSNITAHDATFYGNVTLGMHPIIEQGFLLKRAGAVDYDTIDVNPSNTILVGTAGALHSNWDYVVKAYATTADTTIYGEEISFSTLSVVFPSVTTEAVENVTHRSAKLLGTIGVTTDIIQGKGFEYKSTLDNVYQTETGTLNDTALFATISSLQSSTTYEYRAFAKLPDTIIYGDVLTFTTLETPIAPVVVTGDVSVSGLTATFHAQVTPGSEEMVDGGFLYKLSDDIWTNAVSIATIPDTSMTISVSDLSANSSYDVAAYIVTQSDTTFGNVVSFNILSSIISVDNAVAVNLYPNPTDKDAMLTISGLKENVQIFIFDLHGKEIQKHNLPIGKDNINLKTDNLASGSYTIRIIGTNTNISKKLIVK